MNDLAEQLLERAPCRRQTVEMSHANGISHDGELVPVGIEYFLVRVEACHVMPFSVDLSCKVVEVAEMPCLSGINFGMFGDI